MGSAWGPPRWSCKKSPIGRSLQAVPVHLVMQGPDADAEQLCGPFAVVVAAFEGREDRGLLPLGDRRIQRRHGPLGPCEEVAGPGIVAGLRPGALHLPG